MTSHSVVAVFTRELPANNFFNIERSPKHGPTGGGGATYVEIPTSALADVVRFFGGIAEGVENESWECAPISVGILGEPEHPPAPLHLKSKSGGRGQIQQNRQLGDRHPAWTAERGFPQAPDDVRTKDEAAEHLPAPVRLVLILTAGGEYWAGHILGDVYPPTWPDRQALRDVFANGGAVFLKELK